MNKQYVMGIDFGTSGVRAGIFDIDGNEVIFREKPFELVTPRPGYAEQRAEDWWAALCGATHAAVRDGNIRPQDIIGIGTDMTACTMMFLDKQMNPIYNAIMWMDVRAADQANRIAACGHPVLKFNGYGNVSPEWMPCKTLWMKENLPEVYNKARYVLSCEDWLGYKLTGRIAKNLNDAAARWYYDKKSGGWQSDFFESIGLADVLKKIPCDVIPMGEVLGGLTKEAANELGLAEGTLVAEGGADAYVAMLALGAVRPGRMALVTGSSHLFLSLSESSVHTGGIFGSFPDAVIQGLEMVEAGQTSTGSIVNWYKNKLCGNVLTEAANENAYDVLNREAEKLPIGSEGLICLDYFQGNRTPYTDGEMRGLISGLSLIHTPYHIYKALMESICYGTEIIFKNFEKNHMRPREVYACGGAVKSRFWMQTHADVSNMPINIPKVSEAPALGSAILGAVAGGAYADLASASDHMVKIADRIEPQKERHEEYKYYVDKYAELYPVMKEWTHDLVRHEMNKHKSI